MGSTSRSMGDVRLAVPYVAGVMNDDEPWKTAASLPEASHLSAC